MEQPPEPESKSLMDKLMPKGKFELSLIVVLIVAGLAFVAYMLYLQSAPSTCYYQINTDLQVAGLSANNNTLSCLKPHTDTFLLCYRNDNGLLALPYCTNTTVPDPLNITQTVPPYIYNGTIPANAFDSNYIKRIGFNN